MPASKADKSFLDRVKGCLKDENIPKEFIPELETIILNKRVDLVPQDFGLGPKGKPDGHFYTFVHDPVAIQKFTQVMSEIFFLEESERIIRALFPKTCYVMLTLAMSSNGGPPPAIPITGPYASRFLEEMGLNQGNMQKMKKCLKENKTVTAGIYIAVIDPSGYVTHPHAFTLVVSPGRGKAVATIIDSAEKKGVAPSLATEAVKRALEESLEGKIEVFRPDFVCKRSLQGRTETCAVWTMFLTMSSLMNPPEWWPAIEKYYLELPENETNKLILQFCWWFLQSFGKLIYHFPDGKTMVSYEDLVAKTQLRKPIVVPRAEW